MGRVAFVPCTFSSVGPICLSRSHLFNRIISDVTFDRELKQTVSRAALYEIADRFTAVVCTDSCMVVQAVQGDHFRAAGKFGKDEPWPDWVDAIELVREGLLGMPPGDGWSESG